MMVTPFEMFVITYAVLLLWSDRVRYWTVVLIAFILLIMLYIAVGLPLMFITGNVKLCRYKL